MKHRLLDDPAVLEICDEHRLHQKCLCSFSSQFVAHVTKRFEQIREQDAIYTVIRIEELVVLKPETPRFGGVDQFTKRYCVRKQRKSGNQSRVVSLSFFAQERPPNKRVGRQLILFEDEQQTHQPLVPEDLVQIVDACERHIGLIEESNGWHSFNTEHRGQAEIVQRETDLFRMRPRTHLNSGCIELRRRAAIKSESLSPMWRNAVSHAVSSFRAGDVATR